jgi:phosphoribosylformimino-5-aminoimidazole carboxamide ribotide isomerase
MLVYPAIDLRGGRCVRLRQGDYSQETVFGDDPAAMARRWVDQGAKALHLVDLDGARSGEPVNAESVRAITEAVSVPCQLGGGMRDESHVREALDWGVSRVVIGSRAARDPDWLAELSEKFPDRILLGIDAKNGMVATDGWLEVSEISALDLARRCEPFPLAGLIYTDIATDGMMAGPNVSAMAEMASAVKLPVIASGGVTELGHVRELMRHGLAGCIIGRALYEGHLELTDVLEVAGEGNRGA